MFEQISLRCSTAAISFIPALSGATGPVSNCRTQSCDYSYMKAFIFSNLLCSLIGCLCPLNHCNQVQVIEHNFHQSMVMTQLHMRQQATYKEDS